MTKQANEAAIVWVPMDEKVTLILPQREEDAARTLAFRDNETGENRYLFLPEGYALCRAVRAEFIEGK